MDTMYQTLSQFAKGSVGKMNLTTNTEIKTIKGWEKFADEHSGESTDWGAYCKPGDIVGEDVYRQDTYHRG